MSIYGYRNTQGGYAPYGGGYGSAQTMGQSVGPAHMYGAPQMNHAMGMQAQQAMMPPNVPSGAMVTPGGTTIVGPMTEESYIENILRMNRGKKATVYMTYENNREWNAKIFKGVIEAAGRDHIILSDPATGMRYLLLTLNLDYITFDEPINYEYPFQGGVISNVTPMNGQS
ncbi:spore coat protein GerQ [Paenibacillus sp. IB182496]|uniref:Spore coat protein GerQ n=1 Tax=Paenibacillus sabuli TaxID=2772509 RepID=A0A927BTM0_9BACL|nr:spore coat protein GerQ [Paenibacillus sabuli]MBD2845676.1 spore coat protein GerQ [Paenibacillus sabuli]